MLRPCACAGTSFLDWQSATRIWKKISKVSSTRVTTNMARSPKKPTKSSSKSSSRSASPEKKSPRKRKAASSKSPKKQHPPYRDMIAEAIYEEKKWTKGSSRQAITKFIVANYDVDPEIVSKHITKAIRSLVDEDKLVKNKGSFKLAPKFKNSFKKETGKVTPKKKSGGSKKKTTKRKVTKKGKKKDKDAPKRPTTAWIYFSVKKRDELKKKNPDLSFGDLTKAAGKEWKKLSDAKKAKYNELAAEDKKRYEKEKKAYDKKKAPSSSSSSEESSSSSSSVEKGKKGSKDD